MKKRLVGKQLFYDDKQRENVVSYYLMEDQEHTRYGVECCRRNSRKEERG